MLIRHKLSSIEWIRLNNMANLNDTLPIDSVWRHHHTDSEYTVLMLTNVHTTQNKKFPQTVVYRAGESGQVWSRPVSDFLNKFARIE